jgi:hypothetical protein
MSEYVENQNYEDCDEGKGRGFAQIVAEIFI